MKRNHNERQTNMCHSVSALAFCALRHRSGARKSPAIQQLPSQTHSILLCANYLVVSDLVKWNWLLSAVCYGAATGNSESPFLSSHLILVSHPAHCLINSPGQGWPAALLWVGYWSDTYTPTGRPDKPGSRGVGRSERAGKREMTN